MTEIKKYKSIKNYTLKKQLKKLLVEILVI